MTSLTFGRSCISKVLFGLILFVIVLLIIYYKFLTPNEKLGVDKKLTIDTGKVLMDVVKNPSFDKKLIIDTGTTVTDAKLSRYFIPNRNNLRTGDTVQLTLESYNDKGMRQTEGGDFYFAVMSSGNKTGDRWTAGKINDHQNGTYSVYFFAGWSGPAYIGIIMVHPREAVSWLKRVYRPIEGKNLFTGIFVNGSKQEESLCTIIKEGSREGKCIYQSPSVLGNTTPVCDQPPTLPCKSLKFTKSITSRNFLKELLNETRANFLFNRSNLKVDTGHHIQLQIKEDKRNFKTVMENLPKCRKGLAEPLSEGFWVGQNWNSLVCNANHSLTKRQVLSCLKGKKIYLLGDSTTRQWYTQLSVYVGNSSMPFVREVQKNELLNIRLSFQFHPFSFSNANVDLSQERYAADVINTLTELSCNYVLVVSPWSHFTGWTLESYEEMLVLIRSALVKLIKRCPDTRLVIKGTHARENSGALSKIGSSDWILYDMNRLMRNIFTDIAIFIDVWDLNLCYPSRNVIHMPMKVVSQEIKLFLSYICPI